MNESTLMQMVFLMPGQLLQVNGYWNYLKDVLKDTVSRWKAASLVSWLEKAQVLLLFDDLATKAGHTEEMNKIIEEFRGCCILGVTTPEDALDLTTFFSDKMATLPLRMKGLNPDDLVDLCCHLLDLTAKDKTRMRASLNAIEFRDFLRYPSIAPVISQIWNSRKRDALLSTKTKASSLWLFTTFAFDTTVPEAVTKEFLHFLGQLCHECLQSKSYFEGDYVDTLLNLSKELFPQCNFGPFMDVAFHWHSSLPLERGRRYCIRCPALQQMLAGLYVLESVATGTPLKKMLANIEDKENVALYVAGHFLRQNLTGSEFDPKVTARILRNLVIQSERCAHPISYILRVINEMECHPRFTQILLNEMVYPRQIEVHDEAILGGPLKIFLTHSKPEKVFIAAGRNCSSYDLVGAIQAVREHEVNLSLSMLNHLKWGNKDSTNSVAELLKECCNVMLHDLIGQFNMDIIRVLHEWPSTVNLVCLRVRVTNVNTTNEVFKVPGCIPSLMWFEVDFDMNFEEVLSCNLQPINTPLMDLIFKEIADNDVKQLCTLLSAIRRRYSGVRIQRSYLSPQGVTNILKEFFVKDVILHADPTTVNRYRRWRFPELSFIEKGTLLTDDKVCQLTGYDDRKHYSDNQIDSCKTATKVDVCALRNFLLAIESIHNFKYVCANFTLNKTFGGNATVEKSTNIKF